MADNRKEIDVIFNQKSAGTGAAKTVDALKQVEAQANRTREKMEKLANVGSKLALAGGAIVAPFALAMKKYVDTAKDTEPISKRLVELNKKWEDSQVRLGRVTAEIVLPALEKAMNYLDKIIAFSEANPGVVQAALTIGGTLVALGAVLTGIAQVASTVATIQGLLASAGIASAGGAAAGGAAAGGAVTATFLSSVIVPAVALAIGGQIGLWFGNWLIGTNQTWGDIWNTVKMLPTVVSYGMKLVGQDIARFASSVATGISNLVANMIKSVAAFGASIVAAIGAWFRGGKASGGYMSRPGMYAGAEKGREFVLNATSTRAAENAIGSRLTQENALRMMTTNIQVGNGVTISQARRMIRDNQRGMMDALTGAFGGA